MPHDYSVQLEYHSLSVSTKENLQCKAGGGQLSKNRQLVIGWPSTVGGWRFGQHLSTRGRSGLSRTMEQTRPRPQKEQGRTSADVQSIPTSSSRGALWFRPFGCFGQKQALSELSQRPPPPPPPPRTARRGSGQVGRARHVRVTRHACGVRRPRLLPTLRQSPPSYHSGIRLPLCTSAGDGAASSDQCWPRKSTTAVPPPAQQQYCISLGCKGVGAGRQPGRGIGARCSATDLFCVRSLVFRYEPLEGKR